MKTKIVLIGMVFLIAGCGFEPMYGTTRFQAPDTDQIALESKLAQIEIENIPNREGQFLRNLLIDRFYQNGKPAQPQYRLSIATLRESISDLDITKESDSTRAQLRLDTAMTLIDSATGEAILTRNLRAIGSYNILTSEFSTRVSENSTRENVLNDLARQIELQIALFLETK